jgi:hypothetical protein
VCIGGRFLKKRFLAGARNIASPYSIHIRRDLLTPEQECQKFAHDTNNIKIFDTNFLHILLTYTQIYKVVDLLKWFFLLFPIVLGIFFFLYDRYLVYRAGIFQQQVEMLEKLWQESIEQ